MKKRTLKSLEKSITDEIIKELEEIECAKVIGEVSWFIDEYTTAIIDFNCNPPKVKIKEV